MIELQETPCIQLHRATLIAPPVSFYSAIWTQLANMNLKRERIGQRRRANLTPAEIYDEGIGSLAAAAYTVSLVKRRRARTDVMVLSGRPREISSAPPSAVHARTLHQTSLSKLPQE